MVIGFLGGTGPEGRGLALRFALAGEKVIIGSRDKQRADEAAASVAELAPPDSVTGGLNDEVAFASEVVFVAVPYGGHRATLDSLRELLEGKVVVDVVAPLEFKRGRASALRVDHGSAALEAQAVLPNSTVVAAFQNVSAEDLLEPESSIESDVIVCADDEDAKSMVIGLANAINGIRGVDGGGLQNARYVEDFTAMLLNINRIYKAHSTIRIVGI
ncbi:MAG: NADPH-dependent F420 reductase [SAR202 cluster bacterium]|nr:NADPH-dependent F420 reductase [SAR202 cluster bacterium]MDP6299834.1 NADPH-dependent F420 reductase [SAR202 cluster bacterium]MDP7102569.1 NADPH-dependent F420 reductase [SAR202 cluster bacterium]MDP7223899.1 NADPH-dependent F420 reductase [SAR202 cluster bacterium]MDP7532729.1 NADPH-dependent F420 reductase [SAR202 cluster bacterium]